MFFSSHSPNHIARCLSVCGGSKLAVDLTNSLIRQELTRTPIYVLWYVIFLPHFKPECHLFNHYTFVQFILTVGLYNEGTGTNPLTIFIFKEGNGMVFIKECKLQKDIYCIMSFWGAILSTCKSLRVCTTKWQRPQWPRTAPVLARNSCASSSVFFHCHQSLSKSHLVLLQPLRDLSLLHCKGILPLKWKFDHCHILCRQVMHPGN